jgi:hypothetical protein
VGRIRNENQDEHWAISVMPGGPVMVRCPDSSCFVAGLEEARPGRWTGSAPPPAAAPSRTGPAALSGSRPCRRVHPAQQASPLGRRPYDLRHAVVSLAAQRRCPRHRGHPPRRKRRSHGFTHPGTNRVRGTWCRGLAHPVPAQLDSPEPAADFAAAQDYRLRAVKREHRPEAPTLDTSRRRRQMTEDVRPVPCHNSRMGSELVFSVPVRLLSGTR